MRIALDAMGGDQAPGVIIEGARLALEEHEGKALEILIVGPEQTVQQELDARGVPRNLFSVVDAPDVVTMDEQPSVALRRKKNSSIAVGLRLQKERKAEGFLSAGNTGAVVANALFTLGRIEGVSRPAIATFVPTRSGGCILLDVGANIDCKPSHLVQFGIMGSCYAERVLGKRKPRVGLLNIGEESTKGDEVVQEAYKMLESSALNFVGNVEGRDIFAGNVDVVVCDGFVGNIVLKFAESVVDMVYGIMKESIASSLRAKLGALLLKPTFYHLRSTFDYAEYGGAPLLGVDGVCTICHGRSSVRAIKNAILATKRFIEYDVNSAIREGLVVYEQDTKTT